MGHPEQLTALQLDVARIFFSLDVTSDFLVAGGAALLASNLIARPTEDLDLLALFGRAAARDFADVYVLARRFGKDALLEQAEALDAGFDRDVPAQMIGTLSRFDDEEIPISREEVPLLRQFFTGWARKLG